MKPNKPLETYSNRVAAFEASERKSVPSPAALPSLFTQTGNIFADARIAVLNKQTSEVRAQIVELERTGKTNVGLYNRFISAMLKFVGDSPSHELRNHSESCGCFSCRDKVDIKL